MQERVLYYDTDSVIYSSQEEQEQIEFGNYLGQLTNGLWNFVQQDPHVIRLKLIKIAKWFT